MQGRHTKDGRGAKMSRKERLGLLDWAHGYVRRRPAEFLLAGQCLDMTYGKHAVRDRRRLHDAHRHGEGYPAADGFPSAGQIGVEMDDAKPRLLLQQRLACAYIDLVASPPDMTPLAARDPLIAARSALLVACLVTDRDAGEYCSRATELAGLEWLGENVVGRGVIAGECFDEDAADALMDVLAEARLAVERHDRREAQRTPLDDLSPAPAAPSIAELTAALIGVEVSADLLAHVYGEARAVHATSGAPRREHYPDWRAVREARSTALLASEREGMRARGEAPPDVMFGPSHPWEATLEEYADAYRTMTSALAAAIRLVAATPPAGLRAVPPLPEHFALDLGVSLRFLSGLWHPTEIGPNGFGRIRCGCPEAPEEFRRRLNAVQESRVTLQSVTAMKDQERGKKEQARDDADRQVRKPGGWTLSELRGEIEVQTPISARTFDRIRGAAKIPPAEKNGRGAQRRLGIVHVRRLARAAEGEKPRFRNGKKFASALRQLICEEDPSE